MQRRNIGLCVVFAIITCGIYMFYWMYQINEAFQVFPDVTDNSILYLILSILNLDIVNYCLIQNDINRYTPE